MAILMIPVPGVGTVESFDTATMPRASVTYAIEYGLKQALADSYASVTKKTHPDPIARRAARKALADKRLAQLRTGNVPGGSYVPTESTMAAAESGMSDGEVAALIRAESAKRKAAAVTTAATDHANPARKRG